jgi:F-type H+-transporting ATPase subunit alpha
VTRFEAAMLQDMRANHADILKDIHDKRDLSDETKGKLKSALDAFAKSFA